MKPARVFLHGWGLHGGLWAETADACVGTTAHCPDLPGYGGRARVTPYDAEHLADAVVADWREPAVVIGWSLGGMVAQALAARHPDRVRALVLVGSSPAFVQRTDWPHGLAPEVLDGFAQALAGDYRATLLRFLSLQARGGDEARAVIARLRATVFERGEPDPASLAAGLDLLRSVDLRARAPDITCPTLVLHGGHDTLCPPDAGAWLAATIPGARLVVHPGAAHAPFLSHPGWFQARLTEFLDGHGA